MGRTCLAIKPGWSLANEIVEPYSLFSTLCQGYQLSYSPNAWLPAGLSVGLSGFGAKKKVRLHAEEKSSDGKITSSLSSAVPESKLQRNSSYPGSRCAALLSPPSFSHPY
ncbi:uncharacterized [Tachysurus ichikawai]